MVKHGHIGGEMYILLYHWYESCNYSNEMTEAIAVSNDKSKLIWLANEKRKTSPYSGYDVADSLEEHNRFAALDSGHFFITEIAVFQEHIGGEGMDDYTKELEKLVIYLCETYTMIMKSLEPRMKDAKKGIPDEDWFKVYAAVPTIQGLRNRMMVERIGKLNENYRREGFNMSLTEIYEKLASTRPNETSHPE